MHGMIRWNGENGSKKLRLKAENENVKVNESAKLSEIVFVLD